MFGMILLAAQMYLPVPGGFAISNGEAEFSRPLYGWHGNDCMANPSKILVWTVDRPAYIRRMVSMGVDNIITNRPDKAAEIIYSNSSGETVLNVLRLVFGG